MNEMTAVNKSSDKTIKKKGIAHYIRKDWMKYAMLSIPVLLVLVFCYLPMYGVLMSFQHYNLMKGIWHSTWVGLDNFQYIFSLPRFGRVLRNTLVINLLSLILSFPAPVLFAVFLSEMRNVRIVKIVQTVSYLPHFLSAVIIAGIVYQMCTPTTGLFNQLILSMGGSNVSFLTDPVGWLFTYVISGIWENVGWGSIIYIAAISGINPEIFEAAIVDGAGRLKRIWYITLPSIRPTIVLMLILSMGGIISIGFDRPWAFSNSLVNEISEVISVFVYNIGLGQGNFDVGTTVGLFQSVVGAVMVIIVNQISKRMGEQGI